MCSRRNKNIGDGIDYGQQQYDCLGELISDTLSLFEQRGGEDAFINIKYMVSWSGWPSCKSPLPRGHIEATQNQVEPACICERSLTGNPRHNDQMSMRLQCRHYNQPNQTVLQPVSTPEPHLMYDRLYFVCRLQVPTYESCVNFS